MVVYTEVEVEVVPPEAMTIIAVMLNDLHPSHSMSHVPFPREGHMHENIYLHDQPIEKMSSIGLSSSSPYFACIHILHVDVHKLGKLGTMVHCHNSMGLVLLTTDSFRNRHKYLWYVHLCDTEYTKGLRDALYPY